jgi:GDP-4-dehydro-6-deoxy-D-mannose reductase
LRILITGAAGFVGLHLIQQLRTAHPDAELHGIDLRANPDLGLPIHTIDMRDAGAMGALIVQIKPDRIYHLAAQANVKASFADPWATLENNLHPQVNMFQACLAHNLKPRILIISTGELYANSAPKDRATDEHVPPQPTSPYSVSKIGQEQLGVQYALSYGLPILIARPFNHIGPGQREGFVAPDFAVQIARIEQGAQPPVLHVGDLSAKRDFSDVRDVVRAYQMIMEGGAVGEIYNVASGHARPIQDVLDVLLSLSTSKIDVQTDPERMRPSAVPLLWGDASKLRAATGWQPQISFEQSLGDVLAQYRAQVRASTAQG